MTPITFFTTILDSVPYNEIAIASCSFLPQKWSDDSCSQNFGEAVANQCSEGDLMLPSGTAIFGGHSSVHGNY